MNQTREELLERLLEQYGTWYNLERLQGEEPLTAVGEFHEHGTGYVFVRKAQMWVADCHEYLYIFSVDELTEAVFQSCLQKARELGKPKIQPGPGHKSSYVTALIVCDTANEAGLKALKKCRIRKSFHLSLHGWMEVHTAAVVNRGDIIATNGDGRRTGDFLKNVLHPRKKDLWYKLFKK